jgi:hypothetical protein
LERGCKVHALDISPLALKRVEDVATAWAASELDKLPSDTFDVAISHLVAQHMLDSDLSAQLVAVIRSLKQDGVFAMQFMKPAQEVQGKTPQTRGSAKGGGVFRTPEMIERMVRAAGGRVVRSVPKEQSQENRWAWQVVHIKRD